MTRRAPSGVNALAGIDKPVGITSHDAVARVRRAFGERRVGHAGTLDPLASGVMVVGVGQATRLLAFAAAEDKRYLARLSFGRETETDDVEGATRRSAPAPASALDEEWAAAQMGVLLAMTEQLPPAYSAVQVGGVRAYAAARRGEGLELRARPVTVREAQLVAVGVGEDGAPWWDVALTVSKGTYVRALARDLGRALGSACHVAALRRVASGPVALSDCAPLEELERSGPAGLRPLDPVRVLGCPSVPLSEEDVRAVRDGKRLSAARTGGGAGRALPEGARCALVHGGRLYAVARRDGSALAPQAVFADGVAGAGDESTSKGDVR